MSRGKKSSALNDLIHDILPTNIPSLIRGTGGHGRGMGAAVGGMGGQDSAGIALEKMKRDRFDGHVRRLVREAGQSLEPLLRAVQDLQQHLDNPAGSQSSWNKMGRDGKAVNILGILNCLSGYNEADFEDGLTWVKCLYACS